MAIECISRKKYSEKSDVWSWGVSFFFVSLFVFLVLLVSELYCEQILCSEVLTQKEPYDGLDAVQAATAVVTEGASPHHLSFVFPTLFFFLNQQNRTTCDSS
jgi:hypothetical protein